MSKKLSLKDKLQLALKAYMSDEDVPAEVAVACATADLRHLADAWNVDYGHADNLGYSHYAEEGGQR